MSVEVGEVDRQRRCARAGAEVRERVASPSGDVGLQVRLRLPELVDEAVLLDVVLVEVVRHPLVSVAGADVPDFERHVPADFALHAKRHRMRVRRSDVRIEQVELVGDDGGQRIHWRVREWRHRTHPGRVAEQQRQRAEVAERGVSARRDRDTRIAAEHTGKVADAIPVVGHRVGAAEHSVAFISHQPAEQPALLVRPPHDADRRREVVVVGLEGGCVRRVLQVLRLAASQRARLEQVVDAGNAENGCVRRGRVRTVPRDRRLLELPAQTVVEREVLARAPLILREEAELVLLAAVDLRSEVHVLAGGLVEPCFSRDRAHVAGQRRIEITRCVDLSRRRAREIRRAEHGERRVAGRDAERNRGHDILRVTMQADVHERAAHGDTVRAAQPRQVVFDGDRRVLASLIVPAGVRVRECRAEVPVRAAEAQREWPGVPERRAVVGVVGDLREERHEGVRVAAMDLVHHVRRQRRTQRRRPVDADRILAARDREAGERGIRAVQRVGRRVIHLTVVRAREAIALGQVVVAAKRRVVAQAFRVVRERGALLVQIGQVRNARTSDGGADVTHQLGDGWIEGRGLPVGGGELQKVHPRAAVREDARHRIRREDRALARDLRRLPELFEVEKEERFVTLNRAAQAESRFVQEHLIARRLAGGVGRLVAVVEPVVRVPLRVALVVVRAAVKLVRPRSRDELDLHRTGAVRVGARRGARHRHFFDRVETRADQREKSFGRLVVVVLRVDAVDRDADGASRQAADRRVAVRRRGIDARQHRQGVDRVAAHERQVLNLVAVDRLGDCGRLRLDDLGATGDGDHFFEAADFEHDLQSPLDSDVEHQVRVHLFLEPHQCAGQRVGAGLESREEENPLFVGHRVQLDAGGVVLHRDVGARNDAA